MSKTKRNIICLAIGIVLILLTLFPFYVLINMSVRTIQNMNSKLLFPEELFWGNYADVLKSKELWRGMANSVVTVVETTFLVILLSSMAAFGLVRSKSQFSNYIRTVNLSVMMIPSVALLVGTYSLMVKLNLVNTLSGLAFLTAATGIPACLFLYTNFLTTVPIELDEAALIDGAGILRTFFRIIFPQLKAVTITQVIITATGCWNEYLMPMYLLQNNKKQTLILVIKSAFNSFNGVGNVPLACATCAIGILPVILFYLFSQKYIIEGQIEGINK